MDNKVKAERAKEELRQFAFNMSYSIMADKIDKVITLNDLEKNILKMKHCQQLTFDQISKHESYTGRHVQRLYENALAKYYGYYNDKN